MLAAGFDDGTFLHELAQRVSMPTESQVTERHTELCPHKHAAVAGHRMSRSADRRNPLRGRSPICKESVGDPGESGRAHRAQDMVVSRRAVARCEQK
jgi:hypothetical protein